MTFRLKDADAANQQGKERRAGDDATLQYVRPTNLNWRAQPTGVGMEVVRSIRRHFASCTSSTRHCRGPRERCVYFSMLSMGSFSLFTINARYM